MFKTIKLLCAALLIVSFFAWASGSQPVTPKAQEIVHAIRADDLALLQRLVTSPAIANTENSLRWRPLHYAAMYGSASSIRLLLKAGADPNAVNQAGDTPLVYAAWSLDRTQLLVEGART